VPVDARVPVGPEASATAEDAGSVVAVDDTDEPLPPGGAKGSELLASAATPAPEDGSAAAVCT
jgi:hypothetical protein